MNRRLLATVAAVFVVAACSDDREQSPTSPELAPRPVACSYADVKKYARDLFGQPSAGYDLAQTMSGFTAGSADATRLAFDIFAAIAAKRNAGGFTSTDVANAANLTVKTTGCATVSTSPSAALTVAAFTDALKSTGAYEVRGDATKDASGDLTLVKTSNGLSAVNAPPVAGPPDGNGNPTVVAQKFSDWLDVRTLFYASPRAPFSNETSGGRAYDWSLVQPGSSYTGISSPALVAICVGVEDNENLDVFRVEHDATTNTILPLVAPLLNCPNPLPAAIVMARPITDRLLRLITPEPAYAAALGKTGSPTGSAGSFSPFEAVNPVAVVVNFVVEPRDGNKDQAIKGAGGADIKVLVTGAGTTAWEGVTVRIAGVNNNGVTVLFSYAAAVTKAQGFATFPDISTNKTGAYKLLAETQETNPGTVSFLQGSDLSRKFNVRP